MAAKNSRDEVNEFIIMREMMVSRMKEVIGSDLKNLPLVLSYKKLLDEESDTWGYVTVEFGVKKEADHAAA